MGVFFQESFVLGAQGALILFDLTRGMRSLETLDDWVKVVRKYDPMLPIVLIGSKADLVKEIRISSEMVENYKENFNFVDYLSVSSKTGLNVDEAFLKSIITSHTAPLMQRTIFVSA